MNVEPLPLAAAPRPRTLAVSAALTFVGAGLGLVASSHRSATLMLAGISLYVLGVLGRYLWGRRVRVLRLPQAQRPQRLQPAKRPDQAKPAEPPRRTHVPAPPVADRSPGPDRTPRPPDVPRGLTVEAIFQALDGPGPQGGRAGLSPDQTRFRRPPR